jgi:hypothetical protein
MVKAASTMAKGAISCVNRRWWPWGDAEG